MSARLLVPGGAPANASGGETLSPSQVYFDGIVPPGSNAVDVSVSAIAGPVLMRSDAPIAGRTEATQQRVRRPLPRLCHQCSGREKPIGGGLVGVRRQMRKPHFFRQRID